jgi:hypothetical protein
MRLPGNVILKKVVKTVGRSEGVAIDGVAGNVGFRSRVLESIVAMLISMTDGRRLAWAVLGEVFDV